MTPDDWSVSASCLPAGSFAVRPHKMACPPIAAILSATFAAPPGT